MGARGRTIGILGGMGPLATADLYQKIILATPAASDQEHLHVIIDADPSIPDRTAALTGTGPDPLPALLTGARRLHDAGADFILIPCNTAHAFLPALREQSGLRFLDMIAETAQEIATRHGGAKRIGIMGTHGTVQLDLYGQALREQGYIAVYPSPAGQGEVSAGIYEVKGGDTVTPDGRFARVARELIDLGAEIVVAGCTEIPLLFRSGRIEVPLIDPTDVVAHAAVREALA